MSWLVPVAAVLICVAGMCLLMGAAALLGRRRERRGDRGSSTNGGRGR